MRFKKNNALRSNIAKYHELLIENCEQPEEYAKNFENISQFNDLTEFKSLPEKKENEFKIGENNIKQVGQIRTVKRVSNLADVKKGPEMKSKRKTRVTKRGSFMRIHSGKNLGKTPDSKLANIMTNMFEKQYKRDSESEDDAKMVGVTR